MKHLYLTLLFSCSLLLLHAQKDSLIIRREYQCQRSQISPKIDGSLEEEAWAGIQETGDFRQANPAYDLPVLNQTSVKIMYDNTAIYIGAMLYDASPDSVARQLGNRDDFLNADAFRIVFDTYNTEQDGFVFIVYASGVQSDGKFSDETHSSVWESAVKMTPQGWSVEMKIPYSALRFPNVDEQLWGMQITRSTIRNGAFDQWALTPKGVQNFIKYWGYLKGIQNIKAPLRLSLTPYVTAYTSHYPSDLKGENNYTSNVTGGMDLKYGINESFTVDATLLPDFTQVQSDNVVKNLSAFEILYNEQRPFFQESGELFAKGGLFYSRRIGRRPTGYYDAYAQTAEGETIIRNPDQAKLLNATKVSGRTTNGLGVGLMNAILDNTYAVAKDSLGNERKILTEPFSNYNILVFDQQMKNSSSAYIINTNVTRKNDYPNANVSGAGFRLNNRKGTYALNAETALSNVFTKTDTIANQYTALFGYRYGASFRKTSGRFQFNVYREGVSPTYNNNLMGISNETNWVSNGLILNYYTFEPKGIFLRYDIGSFFSYNQNFTTGRRNGMEVGLDGNATFRNFWNIWGGINSNPVDWVDYYEARTPGRIVMRTKYIFSRAGFSTDHRKRLSFDVNMHYGSTGLISNTIGYNPFYGANMNTNFRLNDKLSFDLYLAFHEDDGDRGWVNFDDFGNIIFGLRKINNVENLIAARYLFRNNLSLALRVRHYWAKAHYYSFYNLQENGYLFDNISYDRNHDFNFNAFNIDMVFQWQFAPGSSLNLVWKNSIYDEGPETIEGYFNDLSKTFEAKQLNTVSLKLLYFFDYLYLKKKK